MRNLFVDLKANLMFANTIFFIANYDIIAQRLFLFCLYSKISNSALVYLLNKGMSGSRFFFNFKFASQTAIMLTEWKKCCSRGFAHHYSELFYRNMSLVYCTVHYKNLYMTIDKFWFAMTHFLERTAIMTFGKLAMPEDIQVVPFTPLLSRGNFI